MFIGFIIDYFNYKEKAILTRMFSTFDWTDILENKQTKKRHKVKINMKPVQHERLFLKSIYL